MMQQVQTQSQVMGGQQLATSRQAAPRAQAVVTQALFKSKTFTKSPGKGKSGSPLQQGKDIKAQQFKVGLGKQSKTVAIGFTKGNELLVGRAAMLGVATSLVGEVLTGKGALQQLGYETGLPVFDLDFAIVAVAAFNVIAAVLPTKGKFVPDEEELEERPAGPLQSAKVSLATPGKFFGVKGFGFTKANELFVGRLAQLGFAASLIGEGITGRGILGQIGLETGIPLNKAEPLLLFSIIFTLFAAINEGTGTFKYDEDN